MRNIDVEGSPTQDVYFTVQRIYGHSVLSPTRVRFTHSSELRGERPVLHAKGIPQVFKPLGTDRSPSKFSITIRNPGCSRRIEIVQFDQG